MGNFIRKNKTALWLCAIFILLFAGLIFSFLNYLKQHTINDHKETLQILAKEKAVQINQFFKFQKEKLSIIASMDVFKDAALYPDDSAKIETAKNKINELKSVLQGIAILSKEGIVVVAETAPAGTDYSAHPYFISKNREVLFTRYYDLYQKKDFYVVIGPIYDAAETKNIIGAIAFRLELDSIGALMEETVESKNNEVYLIDDAGLLLSCSKHIGTGDKHGVLIQEVESDGAENCLEDVRKYGKAESVEEHEEEVTEYLNYMGNEVFGAHAYVPEIMGCVIAEESADEVSSFSVLDFIKSIFNK
jgi:C4-dicarboxylate-specific signal transduction histidine kinase